VNKKKKGTFFDLDIINGQLICDGAVYLCTYFQEVASLDVAIE